MAVSKPINVILVTSDSVQSRFWSKVDKNAGPDGCWAWCGIKDKDGYGLFKIGKKMYRAHRLSYTISCKFDPGTLVIRHACNNPFCVNPAHLSTGETLDNIVDMVVSGRLPCAKLGTDDVLSIRRRVASGEPVNLLAKEYKVKERTIRNVVSGKHFWHIREHLDPSSPRGRQRKGYHAPSDNGADYKLRGEAQPNAKLVNGQAKEIREKYDAGASSADILSAYGISHTAFSEIVLGKSYKDAGGPIRKSMRGRWG